MGAAGSHFAGSNHEQLLERFGGSESIAISDTFWRDLLTFPQQLTRFNPALLQQELAPTCHSLGPHSLRTCCSAYFLVWRSLSSDLCDRPCYSSKGLANGMVYRTADLQHPYPRHGIDVPLMQLWLTVISPEQGFLAAVSNDQATLHFQKLLVHVLRLLVAARKHEARAPEATNALVLTRAILLYATEHMGAGDLAALVDSPPGFLAEASDDGGEALTGAAVSLRQYQYCSLHSCRHCALHY